MSFLLFKTGFLFSTPNLFICVYNFSFSSIKKTSWNSISLRSFLDIGFIKFFIFSILLLNGLDLNSSGVSVSSYSLIFELSPSIVLKVVAFRSKLCNLILPNDLFLFKTRLVFLPGVVSYFCELEFWYSLPKLLN